MANFTDLVISTVKYGKNNFIEVTETEVEDDDGTNKFMGIKKGFLSEDGKNYKTNIPAPLERSPAKKIAASILEIAGVEEFDYQEEREKIELEED